MGKSARTAQVVAVEDETVTPARTSEEATDEGMGAPEAPVDVTHGGVLHNRHEAKQAEAAVNAILARIAAYPVQLDLDRMVANCRSFGLARVLVQKGLVTEAEVQTEVQLAMVDQLQQVLASLEAKAAQTRTPKLFVPGRN